MARDDAARGPDSEQSLLDRRSYLKMASAAVAGVTGASSAASAASYDTITVPSGSHKTITIGAGETFENTIVDITASGASVEFQAFERDWTLRNVAVRGENPGAGAGGYLMRCNPFGDCTIENCYFGDGDPGQGQENDRASVGIYVGSAGGGTLTIDNVYMANWSGNAVYGSDMGQPDAGVFHGSEPRGSLVVKNSYFENNRISSVRLGTSSSRAENVVVNGGVHRGFWAYWNNPTFVNCDATAARPFEIGEVVHDDIRRSPVRATLKNCRAEGGADAINIKGTATYSGSVNPNPRTEPPAGVPTTHEAAATGGADPGSPSDSPPSAGADGSSDPKDDSDPDDGSDGNDGSDPDGESDRRVLEIVSERSSELGSLRYEFTVEGSVEKHETSGGVAAEGNDSITSDGNGTYTVTGATGGGYGDAYSVSGEIVSMTVDESAATLRYGGQEVDVSDITTRQQSSSASDSGRSTEEESVLEVVSEPDSALGSLSYEFTVRGSARKHSVSGDIAAEGNDSVAADGGTNTVTGVTGGGYGDAYSVSGEIVSMTVDESAATVRYDGEEVAVSDIVS